MDLKKESNAITRSTQPPKRYSRKVFAYLDTREMGKISDQVCLRFVGNDDYIYHVNVSIDFLHKLVEFHNRKD